jgi:hypothetical protein
MAFFILPLLSTRDLDIWPRDDFSRGLMTRAIWKRPCINLFITYFAREDNMLLPRRQITHCKLCFYYTCKFGIISIKYVIINIIVCKDQREIYKSLIQRLLHITRLNCMLYLWQNLGQYTFVNIKILFKLSNAAFIYCRKYCSGENKRLAN